MSLFRDPVWQFVGAVLALFALGVTIFLYLMQRQRKILSYEILSRNQLLTVREELEGRLQVLYEGQPAKDICLLIIKLINTGNIAISSTDYERPVSIGTGSSSKILSAVVTEVEPNNLETHININENKVHFNPVLLNSKDSITIKLLVSDFCGAISLDGRIIGVKTIKEITQPTGYQLLSMILPLIGIGVGVYLSGPSIFSSPTKQPNSLKDGIGLGIIIVSYMAMASIVFKNKRMKELMSKSLKHFLG